MLTRIPELVDDFLVGGNVPRRARLAAAIPPGIIPAIRRGIRKTQEGIPALLEFLTAKEITISNE